MQAAALFPYWQGPGTSCTQEKRPAGAGVTFSADTIAPWYETCASTVVPEHPQRRSDDGLVSHDPWDRLGSRSIVGSLPIHLRPWAPSTNPSVLPDQLGKKSGLKLMMTAPPNVPSRANHLCLLLTSHTELFECEPYKHNSFLLSKFFFLCFWLQDPLCHSNHRVLLHLDHSHCAGVKEKRE